MAGDRDLLERCLDELDNPSRNNQALKEEIRKRLLEVDPGTTGAAPPPFPTPGDTGDPGGHGTKRMIVPDA